MDPKRTQEGEYRALMNHGITKHYAGENIDKEE